MQELNPRTNTVNNEPVIKPVKDRSQLWTWVLVAVLFAAAVAGTWWWQQRTINGLKSKITQLEEHGHAENGEATDTEVAGKVKFVSQAGQYSVNYPSDWLSLICEGNESTVFLAPDQESQALCASEKFSPVSFSSTSDNPPAINAATIDDYASEVTVTDATVDGVTGKKATYTMDGNEFEQAGTKYTQYEFKTNDRTYTATYRQSPGADDLSAEFEAMVQSWKFSTN